MAVARHLFVTPTYGEPFVTKVKRQGASQHHADRPMQIATSGHETEAGRADPHLRRPQRPRLQLCGETDDETHTQTSGDTTITYYTVQLPLLKLEADAGGVQRFDEKVGPYPYNDYTVAEVPTGPSMVLPGMTAITQQAVAKGTLEYLSVHERYARSGSTARSAPTRRPSPSRTRR